MDQQPIMIMMHIIVSTKFSYKAYICCLYSIYDESMLLGHHATRSLSSDGIREVQLFTL